MVAAQQSFSALIETMRYMKIYVSSYDTWDDVYAAALYYIQDGFYIMSILMVFTALLEMHSFQTARALYQKNASLYRKAWIINFVNHFGLAIPCYAFFQVWSTQELPEDDHRVTKLLRVVWQVMQITSLHSIIFYQVHKTFHEYPQLYRWHKFHHQFNTHVPPVSATAVSPVEYLTAYLSPFMFAVILFPAVSPTAFRLGVVVMGTFNVMMHTPSLEAWYERTIPAWMVHTSDHLEHHKRLNCHYAAPTWDIDYALEHVLPSLAQLWSNNSNGSSKRNISLDPDLDDALPGMRRASTTSVE